MLLLDLTDKNVRFPIAYGYQPVKGWSVKHQEIALSNNTQFVKQNALGEAPWDGLEHFYADGFEITSDNFQFHAGTETDEADIFFPDEDRHPWTAWISARTAPGTSKDQAENLFGIYRTLRTPNFNGAGVQIDSAGDPIGGGDPRTYYVFKPNPANVAVDQLLRWGQRLPAIVNFPAWVDWRDYNDETIKWDDSKYTPRNLSLTATGTGSLTPGNTYYVRVSAMRAGDESSASQQTIETVASSITLMSGQTAFQVSWLIKGDELTTPAPPGDLSAFRVYIGMAPGVWIGYFPISDPTLRSLLIIATTGTSAGSPRDQATTGLLRDIKRFECGLFFQPPYSLGSALDRICQISCADWQWSGLGTNTYQNNKVRFMSPATRTPVFTLDQSQVAPGTFKTWPIDRRQRYNQIVGTFRDRDDDLLSAGTPVILDREQMQDDDKQVKTFSIEFGTCYRSQVQRGCSFWARMLCDLDQMASMTGSPKTYHVLPSDVVLVTNDTPDWTDIKFLATSKAENVEPLNIGDPINLKLYADGTYSDTDHSPLARPLPKRRFNPFIAPPVATDLVLTADDVFITGIIGDFEFGAFQSPQKGRIFKKGPWVDDVTEPDDSTYEFANLVEPDDLLHGHFEIRAIKGGKYSIKVETESILGIKATSGHPVAAIDIRPAQMTDARVGLDGYGDLIAEAVAHPRLAEQPADCVMELWVSEDRATPANLKATVPMETVSAHPCTLAYATEIVIH